MADTLEQGPTPKAVGHASTSIRECRVCFLPLELNAEQVIGVHIWCVKQQAQKPVIRSPAYGRRPTF